MTTPFQQLFSFNKTVQLQWTQLGDTLEQDGFLSAELKEQVRRVLAQENGCAYCKAKGKPDLHNIDEKTAVCTSYAEAFLKSNGHISPNVTSVLKNYLTNQELAELIAFICFTTASQYAGAIHQLQP